MGSDRRPVNRAALLIKLHELVVDDHVVILVVARLVVSALGNKLTAELCGGDTNTWDLASCHREARGRASTSLFQAPSSDVDGARRACFHHHSTHLAG